MYDIILVTIQNIIHTYMHKRVNSVVATMFRGGLQPKLSPPINVYAEYFIYFQDQLSL